MVVKSHRRADWLRTRASRFLLAAVAAGAVALAGCSAAAGPAGSGPAAKVALTFTFTLNDGPGTPVIRHWRLSCEPAGGTRPGAAAACAALLRLNKPFAPLPKGIACPMILRSDRKLVVTGTWFGTKVHRIVVDGGCDMTLFSRLDRIFR